MMDSTVMFEMLLTVKTIVVYLILVLFLIDLARADSYNKIARIIKILLFPLLLIFNVHYKKINIGLPLYLTTIYRFFGLYLMTIGSLIIVFVYVTRLGTKTARNCIFLILFVSLFGIYFLVLNYLSSSPLMPVLYFLTFCLSLSVFFSKHLPD